MPKTTSPQPRRAIPDGPLAGRVKGPAPALAKLAKAGVTTTTALRQADLAALGKRTKLSVDILAAIHLQAEIPGLDATSAKALVTKGGVRSRDALATSGVEALVRKLDGAVADPRHVAAWVAIARSGNLPVSGNTLKPAAVRRALAPLMTKVRASSPHATIIDPVQLLDPVLQTEALARMRGLLYDAGVDDLAALGTYSVDPSRVIHPGYHLARPTAASAKTATAARKLEAALLSRGRSRYRRAEVDGDLLWLKPPMVTDAVIFSSALLFLKPGDLVLSREVTSLVIITDKLNAMFVRKIRYEDDDRAPEPRDPLSPATLPVGEPDHNPALFTAGEGNAGADGGDGSPGGTGYEGTAGNSIGPAPSITLYVKRTPDGLPIIDLTGRPGGDGGPGQHGGRGGDGAAGRPGKTVTLVCTRSVGNGGDGGNGGRGGSGGRGGQGATGGSLSVYTLSNNIEALYRGGDPMLSGGPGGAGGDRGLGGSGGAGGRPGEPRGVCSAKPERTGSAGSAGASGQPGGTGAPGENGEFAVQIISEADWDAVFNQLRIIRLEPWEVVPGETVRLVAHNLSADTEILYDGPTLAPGYLRGTDLAAGTIDFVAPGGHGLTSIQLRAPDGNGDYVYSQQVLLLILPRLDAITPAKAVPGIRLTVESAGMQTGAVLLLAGRRLPIGGNSVDLPSREENDIPDGVHAAVIVNPDGKTSNALPIDFRRNVAVRIKAWRVVSEDNENDGADRTEDNIHRLIDESPNPNTTWLQHGIDIRLDPAIGTVRVPAGLAEEISSDGEVIADSEEQPDTMDLLRGANADGTFATFEASAVNVYFVNRIRGSTLALGSPAGYVVMEDQTRNFPHWINAAILAHELGHVFGLDHVSADQAHNLMLSNFGRNGTELTDDQAREAFDNAFPWHDPE